MSGKKPSANTFRYGTNLAMHETPQPAVRAEVALDDPRLSNINKKLRPVVESFLRHYVTITKKDMANPDGGRALGRARVAADWTREEYSGNRISAARLYEVNQTITLVLRVLNETRDKALALQRQRTTATPAAPSLPPGPTPVSVGDQIARVRGKSQA